MSKITEQSTSRFVTVDGVKMHYNEAGEGPVLVLLHGSGPGAYGWSNYARNVEPLSKRFRVIVPDLPGWGQSDVKPVGSPVPEWWSTKVGRFLDELGIAKAHFVGNSLGGMITMRLAMDRPDKVDRMILMGPGGGIPMFSIFPTPAIKSIFGFYEGEGPSFAKLKAFADQFTYDQSEITDELLQGRLAKAMEPKFIETPPMRQSPDTKVEPVWNDPRLGQLPHETMIVWGREDRVMPLDMAFTFLKVIPRARLFVLPRCGHWAQWEHADEFNRMTISFLDGHNE